MKYFYEFIKFIFIFGVFFMLIFSAFNFPAILVNVKTSQDRGEHILNLHNQNIVTLEEIKTLPAIPKNYLVIPVLNVEVPVVWNSSESKIIPNLTEGVVHYPNTAYPGKIGNVFIVGHSSNWWWDKGGYKYVFSTLNQLQVNDEIFLNYQNKTYIYQVIKKKIVLPNDTTILESTGKSILSLMTCTPVGTSWKRLDVIAKQVWPSPSLNKTSNTKLIQPKVLPVIR